MITEYTKKELSNILNVINEAALKYKGVIPDDCWHEPYMLEQELVNEFERGVRMFGYDKNNMLVGVMGIQELGDITLIRHAYTLPKYQRTGIGQLLLQYLFTMTKSTTWLLGTWQDATWAIRFWKNTGSFFMEENRPINCLTDIGKFP